MIGNVRDLSSSALRVGTLTAVFSAAALLSASVASAHIDLDRQTTHLSRYGSAEIKAGPCGRAGGARGANVYTYRPGATITIALSEFVVHPGYYRIAFDQDGDDGFEDPATITGEFGNCAGDPKCGPGMEDFCNNDTVLLDNLEPHAGSIFQPAITYSWNVTLPNVECTNCTLQIIQVMTDLNIHPAPYPADDLYYQCIDLVLSNDAPDTGVSPPAEYNGINCKAGEPMAGTGGVGGETGGSGGEAGTGQAGEAGGAAGEGGAGIGGAAGTGQAGEAGAGGSEAGSGGLAAGSGGAAGIASAGTGAAAVGGQATAGAAAGPSSGSDDGGGCSVQPGRSAQSAGALSALALTLLCLARRRSVRASR